MSKVSAVAWLVLGRVLLAIGTPLGHHLQVAAVACLSRGLLRMGGNQEQIDAVMRAAHRDAINELQREDPKK